MDRAERIAKARDIFNPITPPAERIAKAQFTPTIEVVKANEPDNQIFGWASVAFTSDGQVEDKEGHSIDIADLEKAAYDFAFTDKAANDMHRSEPFGRMIESMMFTPDKLAALGFPTDKTGWWVGMELPPDRFQSVISGSRPMLSIEGSATLEPA